MDILRNIIKINRKDLALLDEERSYYQSKYGEQAYLLLDFLTYIINESNPDTSISGLMNITNWSESKVKKTKRILTDNNLLHEIYYASTKGLKLKVTYLGIGLVSIAKQDEAKANKK